MTLYFKRALRDIRDNIFVNTITMITIAMIILMLATFALFMENSNHAIGQWKSGIRLMAYLEDAITLETRLAVEKNIQQVEAVQEVTFISREDALDLLREQLKRQVSLLDDLKENPLPDAYQVRLKSRGASSGPDLRRIETLAAQIESISGIEHVEYGQQWIGRFLAVFDLFRLIGFAMGGLFVMAAIFIIANTIRLVLYSRKDELEIMRLVGATERFIKTPFYIQGIIQGGVGAVAGILVLVLGYIYLTSSVDQGLSFFKIYFLSVEYCIYLIIGSMFLGWFGCYLSLKQFLKV